MVVEAIRVTGKYAYKMDDSGNYYVDCPYCNEINNLKTDDGRGYFICGKCIKVFYVR